MHPLAEAASQMHVLAPVLLVHAHPITKAWQMSKTQVADVRIVGFVALAGCVAGLGAPCCAAGPRLRPATSNPPPVSPPALNEGRKPCD